jgi:hypothetical protein
MGKRLKVLFFRRHHRDHQYTEDVLKGLDKPRLSMFDYQGSWSAVRVDVVIDEGFPR